MLGPDDEAGCPGCSFLADNLPAHLQHLNSRETTLCLISRAPYEKIESWRERMGWEQLPWVSSFEGDFNWDFHVSLDEGVAPVMYNVRFFFHPTHLFLTNLESKVLT